VIVANKEQLWARQLTALNTIAVAVSQSLELEHIIKVALAETMRALEVEFGGVYLLEGDRLILKCHAGLSDEFVNQNKELDLEPWTTQKTLVRERLDEGPKEMDERRKREGIQSWISVPLASKEEFIGCLALASRDLVRFGAPKVQFIETVSHQLSVAVENARLLGFAHRQEDGLTRAYKQAERYAGDLKQVFEQERIRSLQLAALNAVIAAVGEPLDLNTVLREALDKVMEVMKVEAGMVLLVNEQGELIPAIYRGLPREIVEMSPPTKVGEGLSGKVVQSGEPMVVDILSADPEAMSRIRGERLKAWVSVPLTAKDKVLGTLDLFTRKERPFTSQDVQLLRSIGSQLGVAIENARLYEETQRRVQELAFLHEAGRTMTSTLDLEQVLTTVMQEATDVLRVEAASVLLLDDKDKELVLQTVVGARAEKVKGLRLPLGQGIAGWVARKGQPLLVPDVREDPHFYSGIDGATGFVTRSVLAVPLKVKGKVIGVIEAVNKTEGDFGQTDVELLSSMTQSAAIAIENARLYEAIEEYSRTLEEKVILRTRNLAEEKSKLDAILHNIAGGLLVVDTEERLILANPVAARVLGFKLEEAIGHKIGEVLGPLLRGFISDLIHQPDPASPTTLEIPDLTQIGLVRCWEQKDCQHSDCPAYGKAEARCWSIPGTRCNPTDPPPVRQGPSTGSSTPLRTGPSTPLRTGLVAPEGSASEKTGDWHLFDCPFYSNLPRLSIETRASTVEDERGEVLGTVIVMRDITALKEMDRLKTLFVSNVSHELRTPITIIKLTVSNLLQYYARLDNQKRTELLETIKRQADILHRLIENILTLSRLDAGKIFLEKVEFDLAAFCRTLLAEFALAAAEKAISLDDDLQEGTTVWADQGRIGQVIQNLLSNAIKFTSAGGKVMITVRWREGNEGLVEMQVSDTGSGISPHDQAHLFERFYRGEATARGIPGTGLGLAIVKEIVEEHGGSVSVESKVGVGSTFRVLLPGRKRGDESWLL